MRFEIDNNTYRIWRHNSRNLTIQKLKITKEGEEEWAIYGYYGNSIYSLSHGIMNLIVSNHSPRS